MYKAALCAAVVAVLSAGAPSEAALTASQSLRAAGLMTPALVEEACKPALQPCDVPEGWVRPKMVGCGDSCSGSGNGDESSSPSEGSSEESSEASGDDDVADDDGGAEESGAEESGDDDEGGADPSMPSVTTHTKHTKGGPTVTTTHTRVPLPAAEQAEEAVAEEESGEEEEEEESAEEEPAEESAAEEEPAPKKKGGKLKINSKVVLNIGGPAQQQ